MPVRYENQGVGGGGPVVTPGGLNTELQRNNFGSFGGVSGFTSNGVTITGADDNSLIFGTTAPNSITAITTTTNPELRFSVGAVSPFISITTEANKNFDFINIVPPLVDDPILLFTSANAVH